MKFVQMVPMVIVSSLLVGAAMPVAVANEAGLQKCRLVMDNMARLACYDAINVSPAAGATTATATAGAPAKSVSSAVATSPGTNDTSADFGLPSIVRAAQMEKITSNISGRFGSWQNGSRITLVNGQVWQVIDDSRGICECDNPKVVVSRGSFGTFFLEIEGKGNAPRVRRVK